MKLSFDDVKWALGVIALGVGMYYRIQALESDNAEMHKRLDQIAADGQWVERHLMIMTHGSAD